MEKSIKTICYFCQKELKERYRSCSKCGINFHEKCLKGFLLYTPKEACCLNCKEYFFVNFHRRNFSIKEITTNYNVKVFYAKAFDCIQLNARKKLNFLIENKKINAEIQDSKGNTLLLSACFYDNIEIVKMLLKTVNPFHSNFHGDFAIHVATVQGNLEIIKLLIRNYPDYTFLLNENGQTALHVSILYEFPTIACLLARHMSDNTRSICDANQQTAFSLASKNPEMFRKLIITLT